MIRWREGRKIYVQDTRSLKGGFKPFYYGVYGKRHGVGVILKEEYVKIVLKVKSMSYRVMSIKLGIECVMMNVVSAC